MIEWDVATTSLPGQDDTEMVHWMQVSITCEGHMTWCHNGSGMEGVVRESFLENVHKD